jgi:hypothetical protein
MRPFTTRTRQAFTVYGRIVLNSTAVVLIRRLNTCTSSTYYRHRGRARVVDMHATRYAITCTA